MKLTEQTDFLEAYCEGGSETGLQNGYNWFNENLTPTLQTITKENAVDPLLLADAWLITGEIHELLNAPQQAITCYNLAIHFHPTFVDGHQWVALVHEQMGDYVAALKHIELAIKHAEDGEDLMEDRQRIQDAMVYDQATDYTDDNLYWKYSELLAAADLDPVVKAIHPFKTQDGDLLRCLYRALGAQQDKAKGDKVWQRILAIEPDATLEEIDLFYWG